TMARKKTSQKRPVLPDLSAYGKNLLVVESDLGESMLLFDQRSENVYALNVTAKIIWATLNEGVTFDHLLSALKRWFTGGVSRDAAIKAVADAFGEFVKVKLLLPRADPVAGFPVGQDVRINQSAKNVRFQRPVVTTFTKEFLRQYHPGLSFIEPAFR